jgi:hypothetical protein
MPGTARGLAPAAGAAAASSAQATTVARRAARFTPDVVGARHARLEARWTKALAA